MRLPPRNRRRPDPRSRRLQSKMSYSLGAGGGGGGGAGANSGAGGRRGLEPSPRTVRCGRRCRRRLAAARRPRLLRLRPARNLRQIVGERRGTFAAVGVVLAQEPGEAADPGILAKALRALMAARPGAVGGKQRSRRLGAEILAPGGTLRRWRLVLGEGQRDRP